MKVSTQSLQETLGSLVDGGVQLATESDVVAGVQPYVVAAPGSEQEVASVLAYANREGLKAIVRGGGTQLNTGLPPGDGDILLSTTRLNQVVEYAPHDMTVTVQAGLRLVDLQSHLARARQWLALDPVLSPGATIGGIISTNVSGARRLRYGGVRDQIIGIRVVLSDGTIAKGGGKVVKNVAGYDLPKLFTGALGTLGVIVAATFRLYPLRAASRTVVLTASTPAPLCDLAVRVIASTLEPTVLDVMSLRATTRPLDQPDSTPQSTRASTGGLYVMTVRFEMEPESADEQAAALVDMARAEAGSRLYRWIVCDDGSLRDGTGIGRRTGRCACRYGQGGGRLAPLQRCPDHARRGRRTALAAGCRRLYACERRGECAYREGKCAAD